MSDQEPPILELTPAPEVFIDGAGSYMAANGVVKLTLFSIAHDPVTNTSQRRIVLRLTCSLGAVMGLNQITGELLTKMRAMEKEPEAAHATH